MLNFAADGQGEDDDTTPPSELSDDEGRGLKESR